ncbi:MAG TPA: response regulator transcription factor [Candidatus Saccharimonadales bacterium]|nr:response regulator transcription factor [Candidatus Saccharimonadales bacterium]
MRNGNTTKLLLIEDDREIADALCHVLAPAYSVTLAATGKAGFEQARSGKYSLIVLDLNLPDMNGLEICQKLREDGLNTPVLILTGQNKVMDKIRLLDAGADDYLTKPFSLGELKARLRVLQRRGRRPGAGAERIVVGRLTLDRSKHRVQRAGQSIRLRRKEFLLLECLMLHSGTVVSRTILGNYAWQGNEKPWTNTIDVHIKHLRDKVDRPFDRQLIRTVHGLGYKIVATEPLSAKPEELEP